MLIFFKHVNTQSYFRFFKLNLNAYLYFILRGHYKYDLKALKHVIDFSPCIILDSNLNRIC